MFKGAIVILVLLLLAELYVIIEVGQLIGAGWTICLLIATTLIGGWVVRQQEVQTIRQLQTQIAQGKLPAEDMLQGPILMLSGLLLLLPGFVTDTFGFLLLVPRIRKHILKVLMPKSTIFYGFQGFQQRTYRRPQDDDVIEGEIVDPPSEHQKLR